MALATATPAILDAALVHEKPIPAIKHHQAAPTAKASTIPGTDQIRIVQPHEYKEAAASLAEAFGQDEVVRYPVDTPDRMHLSEAERYALHKQSMEYVVYAHCLNGLVLTIGENYDCVALWLPPGKNIDDWWTILRSGLWRMKLALSKEGCERLFGEFLPLLSRSKLEVLGEELDAQSWYLNYIGTRASARGKGYAKKLMNYVIDEADKQSTPCYLESSHDINLIIYGKMGFELKKQIYLRRGPKPFKMDVMVRYPRLPQATAVEVS